MPAVSIPFIGLRIPVVYPVFFQSGDTENVNGYLRKIRIGIDHRRCLYIFVQHIVGKLQVSTGQPGRLLFKVSTCVG